jgi:hypothetical protein
MVTDLTGATHGGIVPDAALMERRAREYRIFGRLQALAGEDGFDAGYDSELDARAHADQHGLEIGARWCEPSRLVRASEIAQIAVHDARDPLVGDWPALMERRAREYRIFGRLQALAGEDGFDAGYDSEMLISMAWR